MLENIVGTMAVCASIIITVLGLPAQIYKNFKRKEVESFSASLIVSAFASYMLWTVYAWVSGNIFLKLFQTPGFVLASILFGQFLRYRNKGS